MLGVDLVYLPEFKKQLALGGEAFLKKAFHTSESDNQKVEHLAGVWAAKEAVLKAADLKPGDWLSITIKHDKSGKPTAFVGKNKFEVSISQHQDYAIAVAIKGKNE
jgi:phosphopantetheine--protein transferase-like protein